MDRLPLFYFSPTRKDTMFGLIYRFLIRGFIYKLLTRLVRFALSRKTNRKAH